MSSDGRKGPKIPRWMVTFADLMTLLLTFFVLLLSFAEIDAQRFRRLAGELQKAFGVQREIPADIIPMGTSPVLQQFSPGRPQPIPVDEIRQRTTQELPTLAAGDIDSRVETRLDAIEQQLAQTISDVDPDSQVEVERDGLEIVIRIDEQGSFASGSAQVSRSFRQLLEVLSVEFTTFPGFIVVDGHTDDVPIRSTLFESNWDLSAMRAARATNVLLENADLDPERFLIVGHADTRPRMSNETPEQRAKNRRVEITLRAGETLAWELYYYGEMSGPPAADVDSEPVDLDARFAQALAAIGPIRFETFLPQPAPDPDPIESDDLEVRFEQELEAMGPIDLEDLFAPEPDPTEPTEAPIDPEQP